MQKTDKTQLTTPLLAVAIGVAYLVGGILGDNLVFGVAGFAIMAVVAAGLWLLRGRSETVKGLLDHRDERINVMELRATAFAGVVLIVVAIGAFVVEVARGRDGSPYSLLGAVGGLAYITALCAQRVRS